MAIYVMSSLTRPRQLPDFVYICFTVAIEKILRDVRQEDRRPEGQENTKIEARPYLKALGIQ